MAYSNPNYRIWYVYYDITMFSPLLNFQNSPVLVFTLTFCSQRKGVQLSNSFILTDNNEDQHVERDRSIKELTESAQHSSLMLGSMWLNGLQSSLPQSSWNKWAIRSDKIKKWDNPPSILEELTVALQEEWQAIPQITSFWLWYCFSVPKLIDN